MTRTDEAEIRARLAQAQAVPYVQRGGDVFLSDAAERLLAEDVPALLAEVDRLRTALAGQRLPGECSGERYGCICPRCMARIAAERGWTKSGGLTSGEAEL